MKVFFLPLVLFLIILSCPVFAQRQYNQYICSVTHKYSETAFYLEMDEKREFEISGWKVYAGLKRVDAGVEVSLSRLVNIMDVDYHKESKRVYPEGVRAMAVELSHTFAGSIDVFNMLCYPRDP